MKFSFLGLPSYWDYKLEPPCQAPYYVSRDDFSFISDASMCVYYLLLSPIMFCLIVVSFDGLFWRQGGLNSLKDLG